jgi:HlyD family secretion protein
MKKIMPVILILAIAGGYGLWYFNNNNEQKKQKLYFGTIEATEVKISSEIMGRVLEVGFDEGDIVKASDRLVRIDDESLRAQKDQALAVLFAAKSRVDALTANINNVDSNLRRSNNLLSTGSISTQKYDSIKTEKEVLTAERKAMEGQIEQAKATIKNVEIQIGRAIVYAPVSGTILNRSVEPGEIVMPGSLLFTMADLKNCYVRIYIPETILGRVKIGQKVKIFSDSYPNKHYFGKVTTISSQAEFTPKNVQTKEERVRLVYGVKVAVENLEGELKIGMPVDAEFEE